MIRPVSSASWMKSARQEQAQARMVPARQGFDAGELARAIHDGLEVHLELVVGEPTAQLVLERHALHGLGPHGGVEQRPLAASQRLRAVHGRVRVAHDVHRSVVTVPDDDDADAGTHGDRTTLDDHRFHQGPARACGHVDGVLGTRDLVQEERELVAAHACNGVFFADAGGQALGHRVEQDVACGVTQAVVHPLEAIQVDQEHGQSACFHRRRPLRYAAAGGSGSGGP